MVKIRKGLLLLVFALLAVLFVGCGVSEKDFDRFVEKYDLAGLDFDDDKYTATGSFSLVTKSKDGINVSFKSSDDKLLKVDGETANVYNPEVNDLSEDPKKEVVLTATFTYKKFKKEKQYTIKIKAVLKPDERLLSNFHNLTEEEVAKAKDKSNKEKGIVGRNLRVKNAIVAAIGEDRFDLVDENGENRTLVKCTDKNYVPKNMKVGDKINIDAIGAFYYDAFQLQAAKNTIPKIEVLSSGNFANIKADENETIYRQQTNDLSYGDNLLASLKRSTDFSKVVKMTAKVVVTDAADKKYGVYLEDLVSGKKIMVSYSYVYAELKALNGKIIEFKGITAVDVRDSESSGIDELKGKFNSRIAVIEVLNKDVTLSAEQEANIAKQKEIIEELKKVAGKTLFSEAKDAESEGAIKGLLKESNGVSFKYSFFDARNEFNKNVDLENKKAKILKTGEKGGTLLNVEAEKDGVKVRAILAVNVDGPEKPTEIGSNYNKMRAKNSEGKYVHNGKLFSFDGLVYAGKDNGLSFFRYFVKDKDSQDTVYKLVAKKGLSFGDKLKAGDKFKIAARLTVNNYGELEFVVEDITTLLENGQEAGFEAKKFEIKNDITQEEFKGLKDSNLNKKTTIRGKVVDISSNPKVKTVTIEFGDKKIKITVYGFKNVFKLDKEYDITGYLTTYKGDAQISVFNKSDIKQV